MEQIFYCKECKEQFTLELEEHYYNYNCPKCGTISLLLNYTPPAFKGLPTSRR